MAHAMRVERPSGSRVSTADRANRPRTVNLPRSELRRAVARVTRATGSPVTGAVDVMPLLPRRHRARRERLLFSVASEARWA